MKQPEDKVLAVFFDSENWLIDATVGYFHSPLVVGTDFSMFQRRKDDLITDKNFGSSHTLFKISLVEYKKVENPNGDEMWVVSLKNKYGSKRKVFIRNYRHRDRISWM